MDIICNTTLEADGKDDVVNDYSNKKDYYLGKERTIEKGWYWTTLWTKVEIDQHTNCQANAERETKFVFHKLFCFSLVFYLANLIQTANNAGTEKSSLPTFHLIPQVFIEGIAGMMILFVS